MPSPDIPSSLNLLFSSQVVFSSCLNPSLARLDLPVLEAMIRLSLTNIELSRRDLIDYDRRKQKSKENESIDLLSLELLRIKSRSDHLDLIEKQYGGPRSPARIQANSIPPLKSAYHVEAVNQDEQYASSENLSPGEGTVVSEEGEEQDYIDVSQNYSPEHVSPDAHQEQQHRYTSPTKDDFHYGGFVETPGPCKTGDNTRNLSPFLPDDISTPPTLQLPQRLGSRNLPRSPLFISQNASTSPDRRYGLSLTPQVASRVANNDSPGVMFVHPARRPPRQHRHQTNSFSFDSTERSSAAYEQERVASNSTGHSRPSTDEISLHDDLRGSSLQSSRVASAVSEVYAAPYHQDKSSIQDGASGLIERSKEFIFSSPQLPLPHPFSSVSRSSSPESPLSQSASPLRDQSSLLAQDTREERQSRTPSPSLVQRTGVSSSPPSRAGFSPRSLLRQAQRVMSNQRARSPLHRNQNFPERYAAPDSLSSTSTPRPGQSSRRRAADPQTPSQMNNVYLDDRSAATQPQTPANLPEYRHRSTYHPSYTAPVTRAATRGVGGDGRHESMQSPAPLPAQRSSIRSAWRSFRTHRAASPTGMQQEGFRGLYGGRENGDEEQSWVEGVRINNAESRLWGERDARNDERGLRETPEPDDWRGRRD